jgi:hypothetical protein
MFRTSISKCSDESLSCRLFHDKLTARQSERRCGSTPTYPCAWESCEAVPLHKDSLSHKASGLYLVEDERRKTGTADHR